MVPSPIFRDPPVVETALGIQFDELERFDATHFGRFYECIRSKFPNVQEQARLSPIVERFPSVPRIPALAFRQEPITHRVSFKSPDDSKLIQVQPDRFGFNWKAPDDGSAEYPTYSVNAPDCLEEFGRFIAFCRDSELGEVNPNLCEVVYVNHIWPIPDESAIELFGKVFTGVSWQHSTQWLPTPEAAMLNRVFVIDENKGRLYAEAGISRHRERGDFVLLKMVGRVLVGADNEAETALQLAHDWVVQGFESLTDLSIRSERWRQMK